VVVLASVVPGERQHHIHTGIPDSGNAGKLPRIWSH